MTASATSTAEHLHWQLHPGTGPYALLVHGFLSSAVQWQPNLAALSQVCQPVTVELWGHGNSPAPADASRYTPDAYQDEFEHIRSELGAAHWIMLGYSLGAGLTLAYSFNRPDRVSGSIFTNSTSALAGSEQTLAWRNDAEAGAARIEEGGIAAVERIPVHPRRARNLPPDIYRALMVDAGRLQPRGVANTLRATTPYASVRDRLQDNRRPALLACGIKEHRFRPLRDHAARHMPELAIVDLDAGHAVNIEAADAFNQAVTSFIKSCPTL